MKKYVTLFILITLITNTTIGQINGNFKYISNQNIPEYIIEQPSQIESYLKPVKIINFDNNNNEITVVDTFYKPITVEGAIQLYLLNHTYDELIDFLKLDPYKNHPYDDYYLTIYNIKNNKIRYEQILYDILYDEQLYPYTFIRNGDLYMLAYEPNLKSKTKYVFLYKRTKYGWEKAANKPISEHKYDNQLNDLDETQDYRSIYYSSFNHKPTYYYQKNKDVEINEYWDYGHIKKRFGYEQLKQRVTEYSGNASSKYFNNSVFTSRISNDIFAITLQIVDYKFKLSNCDYSKLVYSKLILVRFDDDYPIITDYDVANKHIKYNTHNVKIIPQGKRKREGNGNEDVFTLKFLSNKSNDNKVIVEKRFLIKNNNISISTLEHNE